jgi:ribonuclease BN (tRNA processing enzyme)
MKIRILGAHNMESKDTRYISLLVDDVLAIDAGALTSSLSQSDQQKLRAVLLTHQHYDHLRDIPALGMNFYVHGNTLDIYGAEVVYNVLTAHLLNDVVYPNYLTKPEKKPSLRFTKMEPGKAVTVAGYTVLAVPVTHAYPTTGFQVTSADGKKVFYSGDTGPSLADAWRQISPDLLIIEVTMLNRWREFALQTGHLTAELLKQELESFREIKGYLPQVVLVHMNPIDEKAIKDEVAAAAGTLKTTIRFGHEGMILRL